MFLRIWKEQPVTIQGPLFLNLFSKCSKRRKLLRLQQLIVLAKHFYMYIKKSIIKGPNKKKKIGKYIHILRTKKILFCFIYPLLILIMMFVTISTKIATKLYITCLYWKKLIFCHLAHASL